MQAPRMMAMKVGRANVDVLVALFPSVIEVAKDPKDVCGIYVVINIPRNIVTEQFTGVGLVDEVFAPKDFEQQFAFVTKEVPNKFGAVRQLPEKPVEHRVGVDRHSYSTPVRKQLSRQDSAVHRIRNRY